MSDTKSAQEAFVKRLEEDDEFEDFPQDTWTADATVGGQTSETRLWEESWEDHDDDKDDFTRRLKEELEKNK